MNTLKITDLYAKWVNHMASEFCSNLSNTVLKNETRSVPFLSERSRETKEPGDLNCRVTGINKDIACRKARIECIRGC